MCKHPVLLIGLGGVGSRIAQTLQGSDRTVCCIDTDEHELRQLDLPREQIISLAMESVAVGLKQLPDAGAWFPENPMLPGRSAYTGAGQVRAVGRLAFEWGLQSGRLDGFRAQLRQLTEAADDLQVKIITGLSGGTGAGCFLQLALLIRRCVADCRPQLPVTICGDFILPAVFGLAVDPGRLANMEAICYAAMKELLALQKRDIQLTCERSADRVVQSGGRTYDSCRFHEQTSTVSGAVQLTQTPAEALSASSLFAYETGRYFHAYQANQQAVRAGHAITPHLDRCWSTLPDIGSH